MNNKRLIVAVVLLLLIVAYFHFDLGRFLELEYLKARLDDFAAWREAHPLQTGLYYFLAYVLVTALSIPGAAVMTLGAGALFGLLWGTVLVSFASSIGATLAFLIARVLLRDWVQTRFGDRLEAVNAGIERDGAMYLFTLRLVPIFPFFVINLVMGLTPMRALTFYGVSQLGMLPGTLVYVNAGTQLSHLESVSGILSPALILSFALLGIFPWIARTIAHRLQVMRVYRPWRARRPRRFDRNLVVIGAGSAGLVTAYLAAAMKAKVTLVEKHRMGGDCLNTGCVPSKALLRSARFLQQCRRAPDFGVRKVHTEFRFEEVMQRVHRVIRQIEPHDSPERYRELGVDVQLGEARITSPWSVEIDGEALTTRAIVIATGASPAVPPIPGLDEVEILTSDNLWELRELPGELLVLGGGPIGCELAQAFARLGSAVTQVEMLPRLLVREDPEVSALIEERFRAEGIKVLTSHRALRVEREGGAQRLICEHKGAEVTVPFDRVLVAVGRRANTTGLGLEELGVETTAQGTVAVNEYLQTRYPNILACGDVAGPYQFTHTAAHQAWYAAVNALFGHLWRFRVDYSVIPWATFTDPEVARVGLNETEAKEQGVPFEVTRYELKELDRAIADDEASGFVKVLTPPGKDRILGVTIVGGQAGELLAEFVLAMRHGLGLNKILATIHVYPTLAEAAKMTAGAWRRAHTPQRLLGWVEGYFRRRLG